MAVRETVVSNDDVVFLSALAENAARRKEAGRAHQHVDARDRIRPPATAAMKSCVEFEDLDAGQRESVWLVHPAGSDARAGRISVL